MIQSTNVKEPPNKFFCIQTQPSCSPTFMTPGIYISKWLSYDVNKKFILYIHFHTRVTWHFIKVEFVIIKLNNVKSHFQLLLLNNCLV